MDEDQPLTHRYWWCSGHLSRCGRGLWDCDVYHKSRDRNRGKRGRFLTDLFYNLIGQARRPHPFGRQPNLYPVCFRHFFGSTLLMEGTPQFSYPRVIAVTLNTNFQARFNPVTCDASWT